MPQTQLRPMYTGSYAQGPYGHGHSGAGLPHGFCMGCGHPRSSCCCGCRECRKEAKEVLVQASSTSKGQDQEQTLTATEMAEALAKLAATGLAASAGEGENIAPVAEREGIAVGQAFIGGGCCVHLSVEYAPIGTANGLVAVGVKDSLGTLLMWMKPVDASFGYQIKEDIVTTKPGAQLTVLTEATTARVRWCEGFSCC